MNLDALMILKYAGSIIAGVYGVYATLTDFKEEKNGRKVLSRKGYLGIALLAVSILVNLSMQVTEDLRSMQRAAQEQREKEEAEQHRRRLADQVTEQLTKSEGISQKLSEALENLKQSSKVLDANAKLTHSTLTEAQRAVEPLPRQFRLELLLSIPENQPAVRAYLDRLDKLKATGQKPEGLVHEIFTVYKGGMGMREEYRFGSPEFPQRAGAEAPLEARVSLLRDISIWIGGGLGLTAACTGPHLSSSDEVSGDSILRTAVLYPREGRPPRDVGVHCITPLVRVDGVQAPMASLRDIDGATVTIHFSKTYELEFNVELLVLKPLPHGRQLLASSFRPLDCGIPGRTCFSGKFKKDR
jgi:hypothetical protein